MSRRRPKTLENTVATAYIELSESAEIRKVMMVLKSCKSIGKEKLLSMLPDVDSASLNACLQDLRKQMILTTIDDNYGNSSYEINYAELLPLVKDRLSILAKKEAEPTSAVKSIDSNFKYRCTNVTKCGARFLAVETDRMHFDMYTGLFSCPRCHQKVGESHPQVELRMTEKLRYYHRKLLAAENYGKSDEYPSLFGPAHLEANIDTMPMSPDLGIRDPIVSASDTPPHIPALQSLPKDCPFNLLRIDEPEPELLSSAKVPPTQNRIDDSSKLAERKVQKSVPNTSQPKKKIRRKSNEEKCVLS